jgi:hypothetical protein
MRRDTWVTSSRVDVARALRSVWNYTTRRLLRHRQGGTNNRKYEREPKHKIDSRFHSYPDLLGRIVLGSEETDSLCLGPGLFEFSAGIRIPLGKELVPSASKSM